MHFLMPNVFQSHSEFKEWFSNPLTGMIEGSQEYNESLVRRLHKVCTLCWGIFFLKAELNSNSNVYATFSLHGLNCFGKRNLSGET